LCRRLFISFSQGLYGALYCLHFLIWLGALATSFKGIKGFPIDTADMDLFYTFFTFQLFFCLCLMILIVFTRKKPRLWLRLSLVFLPVVSAFFTRAYLVGKYGLAGCGKMGVLELIEGYFV